MPVFAVSPLLLLFGIGDPAPGMLRTKAAAEGYECVRYDAMAAAQARPGAIAEPRPRGDWFERTALICTERILRPGIRPPQDDAVLTELAARTAELAGAAQAARPDLKDATWLVETHYGSAQVSTKIGFATKNALMELGLRVSDRLPTLSAGDIDVLTRMPPLRAHPAACTRYVDNGTLREGDALLLVMALDADSTSLHAGICETGGWTWLR